MPQLSDRLLSERVKELESRGLLAQESRSHAPTRVQYTLTPTGRSPGPALAELAVWVRARLAQSGAQSGRVVEVSPTDWGVTRR